MQSITAMWAVLSAAAGLLFVSSRVASAESPEPKSSSPVIATATSGKVPAVPVAGPLAGPRSLKQVGLPIQQTLAEIPADNPQTPEKIALGEKLFFEPRLSVDGTVACASCHDPERAFTDGRPDQWGFRGGSGSAMRLPY
jgi:cytochrome c peroxidase